MAVHKAQPRGTRVEDAQSFKRRIQEAEPIFYDAGSRMGNSVKLKYTTYAKPIKNVNSDLVQFRLVDTPLKNGGGDDDK